MGAKQSPTSLLPNKKNPCKVPKRIHKAEREKQKREHLNELFLQLTDAVELKEQNSGKASILGETTRVVKILLDQIKCLKKENATLLSESQYVTVEKNELQDEMTSLQTQIGELKSLIKERKIQTKLDLNAPPTESQDLQSPPYFDNSNQEVPTLNPVFVIPACLGPERDLGVVKPMSYVSKPHPRYPNPSDSWPFQLLEKQSQVFRKV